MSLRMRQDNDIESVVVIARALRDRFGSDALEIAFAQIEASAELVRAKWIDVAFALSRETDVQRGFRRGFGLQTERRLRVVS